MNARRPGFRPRKYACQACIYFTLAIFTGFTSPDKYGEITGMRNITDTRYAWLLKAFEHQTHHRGQTTTYIRLVGVKPKNERLF